MDNIIYHNFGNPNKIETSNDTGEIISGSEKIIPEGVTTKTISIALKNFLELEKVLNGIVGWGKNSETVALRKEMVSRMSNDEVIIDLSTSDESMWRNHPAYYGAIWDKFNQLRTSGILLEKMAHSPFEVNSGESPSESLKDTK